jgi:hypothetical protein
MKRATTIVITIGLLAGCGAGSSDPASQIRTNEHQMLAALKANNLAKYCSYATDRGECLGSMALAKAFLGSGKLIDLFTQQDLKNVDKMNDTAPVQISKDGTRATIDTGGKGDPDTWVKRGDEWRYVMSAAPSSNRSSNTPPAASNARPASEGQIKDLAASLNHPIFWVGKRAGVTYELTKQRNGTVIVRYLPLSAKVGSSTPYLSVATYPFPGPYQALKGTKTKDAVFIKIPRGGIAEYARSYPASVHVAYPNVDYQVEVYAPTRGTAAGLVISGALVHFGPLKATPTSTTPAAHPAKPTAASQAELSALSKTLGHPIYWVGPMTGYTYELTNASNGNVYVRYLPPGVAAGSPKEYLSVATYPFPNAYAVTKELTKQDSMHEVSVPHGGVAVVNKGYPLSIHLAYPGSDYQVEVFDPAPSVAAKLVAQGRIRPVSP